MFYFIETKGKKRRVLLKEENGITILGPTPIQRRGARAPSSTGSSSSSLSVDGGIIGGGGIMERFDSLKREATKLERNLEEKVSRYQQVRRVRYTTITYHVCA